MRKKISVHEVRLGMHIQELSGSWMESWHFDERVFQAFVKTIGIYPSGALVKLKSGRLAIMIEQTKKAYSLPSSKPFFHKIKRTYHNENGKLTKFAGCYR